jgi:hypothetical protein
MDVLMDIASSNIFLFIWLSRLVTQSIRHLQRGSSQICHMWGLWIFNPCFNRCGTCVLDRWGLKDDFFGGKLLYAEQSSS